VNIAKVIYISLSFLGLGVAIAQHGKPKTGNNDCIPSLISTVIVLTLVYFM
jgi:hypothetical protein